MMPRILIAYDTTEGQTRKIAQHTNHEYTDWRAVDQFVQEFRVELEQ